MADMLNKALAIFVGVIAIIMIAQAVASTNAGTVGTLAWTILSFLTAIVAVVLIKDAVKG